MEIVGLDGPFTRNLHLSSCCCCCCYSRPANKSKTSIGKARNRKMNTFHIYRREKKKRNTRFLDGEIFPEIKIAAFCLLAAKLAISKMIFRVRFFTLWTHTKSQKEKLNESALYLMPNLSLKTN